VLKPTDIAVPVFVLMIAGEAYLSRARGEQFNRRDTWTNILIGLVSIVFTAFFGILLAYVYDNVYNFSPLKIPMDAWWAWTVLLFVDDFAYYWFHRASHEIRLFWNFHVVHHSSNEYNLSVAVRQSWFSGSLHWIFYIPVALLGFPLWAFIAMHGINLVYQFWIHTKLIGSLGLIEKVFNTPSHHRVHHGVNDEYLDKNYGGIFIFWDRLFGTFAEEIEQPRYGIIKPVHTFNLLTINTHGWAEMARAMKGRKRLREKIRCVFGSPDLDF
jgi:alkylglycerol monooxygenase